MMEMFNQKKFTKEVRRRRLYLGLTLREAAKKAKVSFSTLSRVENGRPPEVENFFRLCDWIMISESKFKK